MLWLFIRKQQSLSVRGGLLWCKSCTEKRQCQGGYSMKKGTSVKDGKGDKATAKGLPSDSAPQAEITCLHLLDFTFSKCVSAGHFITSPKMTPFVKQ